jgi:septal ring factor EnvC (AmiA/AmiB activator)
LVTETNDIKSVNYQGLIPVLINAMKEQQDEIERLKKQEVKLSNQETKLNNQQQEIDELKTMVKALAKG